MNPPRFVPRVLPGSGQPEPAELPPALAKAIRQIDHIELRQGAIVADVIAVKNVQTEHSKLLADIGAAVVRIEARLGTTEALAKEAAEDAERAERNSTTNETDRELVKIALDGARDHLQAKKERRAALWSAFGKAAAFVFSVAGLTVIGGLAFRACGQEATPPPADAVTTSEAAP